MCKKVYIRKTILLRIEIILNDNNGGVSDICKK